LVKPDGMSAREFHQYWLETHSPGWFIGSTAKFADRMDRGM
jgi:hypothetical protein